MPWFTVVGVAKDVKQGGLDQQAGTEFYFFVNQLTQSAPASGAAPGTMNVVLRTTLAPAALASTIERAVGRSDPSVPVVRLQTMDAVFGEAMRRPRFLAQLLTAFAGTRCCSRPSARMGCCPTWSRSGGARLACG